MKTRYFFLIYILFFGVTAFAQDTLQTATPKYLEDQFYAGITYNLLQQRPEGVSQNSFSNSIQLGYIKDIPLNERRNVGIGIGLGYAINSYYTNLRASEAESGITYELIDASASYKRNKIETHLVEIPVEFRWRTSTAEDYKFWRIYTGVKLGYVFANSSKYIESDLKDKFSNPDIQKFQYGVYISFGYNTWNFYANYQLSSIFREGATIDGSGEEITMNALKIGLIFYIL